MHPIERKIRDSLDLHIKKGGKVARGNWGLEYCPNPEDPWKFLPSRCGCGLSPLLVQFQPPGYVGETEAAALVLGVSEDWVTSFTDGFDLLPNDLKTDYSVLKAPACRLGFLLACEYVDGIPMREAWEPEE